MSRRITQSDAARHSGFTLIELMIAVALLAILVGLALPSYTRYIDRARRADATDALIQLAAQQERNYSRVALYESDLTAAALGYTVTGGWAATAEGTYRFQVATPTVACPIATCYLLVAEPIGVQARDQWQFRLLSTGQRQSREGGTAAWAAGWPER